MKSYIVIIALVAGIIFVACKKTRTCSCKTTDTTTNVITPRSAASSTTTSNTSYGTNETSYDNIKTSEMRRDMGCVNRSETTTNTSTTQISVPTVTSVGGYTYTTFIGITADRVTTEVTDYDCNIK